MSAEAMFTKTKTKKKIEMSGVLISDVGGAQQWEFRERKYHQDFC